MQGMTGKIENGQAHRDRVRPAVGPLTSTLFVLIKTRCRENDCREERNTGSDKHGHAHAHNTHVVIHTLSGEEAQPSSHNMTDTSGEMVHAQTKPGEWKF